MDVDMSAKMSLQVTYFLVLSLYVLALYCVELKKKN